MGYIRQHYSRVKRRFSAFCVCAVFIVCLQQPGSALAIEINSFSETPPPSMRLKVSAFLSNQNKGIDDFNFAKTDLNGDQVDEYLLRSRDCDTANFCRYYILALMGGKAQPLLSIDAKDVKISGTKTNGVHDILAIRSKKNDYKYLRYIWSPADMSFMPAEQFIEGQ